MLTKERKEEIKKFLEKMETYHFLVDGTGLCSFEELSKEELLLQIDSLNPEEEEFKDKPETWEIEEYLNEVETI